MNLILELEIFPFDSWQNSHAKYMGVQKLYSWIWICKLEFGLKLLEFQLQFYSRSNCNDSSMFLCPKLQLLWMYFFLVVLFFLNNVLLTVIYVKWCSKRNKRMKIHCTQFFWFFHLKFLLLLPCFWSPDHRKEFLSTNTNVR